MNKYFFGYLFVRIAKLLALLTVLAGIGFALFRLEQANLAAQAASYQPSPPLQQSLNRVGDTLTTSRQLVRTFCEQNGGTAPPFPPLDLALLPSDNADFARLDGILSQADLQRRQLKDTLVARFEALVAGIQTKLRTHAAEVAPPAPPPVASNVGSAVVPRSTPSPTPLPDETETLYGGQMNNFEIGQRTSALDRGKELLKVLQAASENPANRQILTDSVAQLDALTQLLPAKVEPSIATSELPAAPVLAGSPAAAAPRPELNAEKVADQLGRLRGQVRQTMLTSWTLDVSYAQANELAAAESSRCRLASLSVKSIWLASFGQLGLALLASLFTAFLVLVLADFMQTLLDTATNTGIVAESTTRPTS